LFHNIKAAMDGVPLAIVKRQLVHFYKADPEYGIGVATRLGLEVSDLPSAVAAE
jgi:catalase